MFWCTLRDRGATPRDLAFVRFYTTEGAGQRDATRLTKIEMEKERRVVGGRYVMVPKTAVVEVSSIIKLEHIIPLWTENQSEQSRLYYVNKYASFC